MCVYITGHLNSVFPAEHRREILRYIYCHQVKYLVLTIYRTVSVRKQESKFLISNCRMKMVVGDFILRGIVRCFALLLVTFA